MSPSLGRVVNRKLLNKGFLVISHNFESFTVATMTYLTMSKITTDMFRLS
jgi:hypothetical protein